MKERLTRLMTGLGWKDAVYAVAILAMVFGSIYLLNAPERARKAEARADATEIIAESSQGAARDTIHHYDRLVERVQTIDQRTEVTNRDILAAPGATARIDPELHRAGLRALCLHDNRNDAVCELVLYGHDGSEEPAKPDAARPGSR